MYRWFWTDILGFDFGVHLGTPGMCLGCFLMVFSDSWARKNLFLPPTQKIFIFAPCEGPLRGALGAWRIWAENSISAHDFISRFSTTRMGLNHVLMIFSDSLTPKIGVVMWGDLGVYHMASGGYPGFDLGKGLWKGPWPPLKMGKSGKMSKNEWGCVENGPKCF